MKKLLVAVTGAFALAPSALGAPVPVPSLTPAATHALWSAEVARARADGAARRLADAQCRPARAIFYAQTDWLRLATKLAQAPSPCAQYYVSVPPLAADKTQARAGQAAQIRALGPAFHALDEVSYTGWSNWVAAGSGTWYDAGVLARGRMAAAGFDTAAGDTWALNEISSAVRKGTGAARQNARDFIRGLASDGTRGAVFVTGVGQSTSDLAPYKVNLQSWLQDSGFWTDVAQSVSDWQQETYGDVRNYAAEGATPSARRDALEQYLAHPLTLANSGPDSVTAAKSFLQGSYGALANGAWAWASAYGWTQVPYATMQDYVSGQVYAARAVSPGAAFDRLGFAWAPNNTMGLAGGDYTAQTAAVLERIAAAIRDSGVPSEDPGSGACAPPWCTAVLGGAALTPAWQTFATWSPSSLAFASPPATLSAGTVAGPLTVQLQTAGVVDTATADKPVTLSSTSAKGAFATASTGPWSPTLTLTIPAGGSSATFFYTDTLAGTATVAASAGGGAAAAQPETVTPAALAKLAIAPGTATVAAGKTQAFSASGVDAYGNAVAVAPSWTLASGTYGRLTASTGLSTTFVAGKKAGATTLRVAAGGLTASAAVAVTKPATRVSSVRTAMVRTHLVVTARVVSGTAPARGVALTLSVRRGSSLVAIVRGRTGSGGTLVWRSRRPMKRAHYVAKATLRSASTASRTQQRAM